MNQVRDLFGKVSAKTTHTGTVGKSAQVSDAKRIGTLKQRRNGAAFVS
jgi:hypothetical protein